MISLAELMKVKKAAPSTSAKNLVPFYNRKVKASYVVNGFGELPHHRIDRHNSPVCPSTAT